ncbi:MAG: hypothetical protein OSW71_18085, partial [Proteobacteria bacterium]|nr:hypothetical protein [Pseudomonadota bacterium]
PPKALFEKGEKFCSLQEGQPVSLPHVRRCLIVQASAAARDPWLSSPDLVARIGFFLLIRASEFTPRKPACNSAIYITVQQFF